MKQCIVGYFSTGKQFRKEVGSDEGLNIKEKKNKKRVLILNIKMPVQTAS